VIGREMAELIVPPSLRAAHRRALARYVETREPTVLGRRLELVGMRADGTEFPVEVAINRIGSREPPMFTGTVRDITRRKANEEEREELLRLEQLARLDADQARDQLEAILYGVADGITAQGPDGKLLFANAAAVEALGYSSSEELLAAPVESLVEHFDMLTEDGRPFPVQQLPGRRALVDGVPAEAVVRFRVRATGEERWSAVKATPILDGGGRVTMAINVIEDITTHKRAEMAQRFLADSSALLSASLDPDELLRQVASLAVPEVADWCAVDLRDELGGPERVALAHFDPAVQARGEDLSRRYPPDPTAEQGVPKVLRTGVPELYPEITDDMVRAGSVDEEQYRLISELGMRSAMIVPLKARKRTMGALSFVTGRSGRRFDTTDLRLAEELARRCSTAVDNARLYTERAYIARTLQQSLLPVELPDIPGIDAAARFRPTGDGNEVGGDFYDMFASGGRGWTVVMGDVCGKGPDAAAVTALARYTLRAAAARERLPSRSLRLLNKALLSQRDDRRFCTVAYAYIEMLDEGARVGFASGGHPLPLHLRADGWVEPVGTPGTLLGVVPDPSFEDRAVALDPGDSLVFYTDGVIEGRGDEPSLNEERLAELVAACAGREADAIAAEIEQAAVRGQRGGPRDDIAVLVLRVAP
jgi:PAS domain S-box-containing protein